MRLTKREAQVLDYVSGDNASFKEVGNALGVRAPNLSRYMHRLARFGFVYVENDGRSKVVSLDPAILVIFYPLKGGFPQLKLSEVLAGDTPFFLTFIREKESFRLRDLDLPPATSKRILARLRHLGLVSMPKKGVYRLRDEARAVADFCKNALMLAHLNEAREEIRSLTGGIFSFDSAREFSAVFTTYREASPEHYWPTALSVAHEYGLQLLPSGRFFYSNVKPDLGDVIVHTLAIEKNARGVIYAAYLALKNGYDMKLLLKKRQTFGLGREYIKGFAEFIESRGGKPFAGLTGLDELRSLGYGDV